MNSVRSLSQAGSRLSWNDSLFETVPQVQRQAVEPPPAPEAIESDWAAFDDAQGGDEPLWRVVR